MYKNQVRDLGKVIQQQPADYFPLQDSPFIGTVNFDLRKPNFVIIHHTAQNGCPETTAYIYYPENPGECPLRNL